MKKFVLVMIIFWCVIAVGLASFMVVGGVRATTTQTVDLANGTAENPIVDESLSMDGISKVAISLSSETLHIRHASDGNLRLVQYGRNLSEHQLVEAEKSGSTISVSRKKGVSTSGWINWGINVMSTVDLYIPEDFANALNINLSAGTIIFEDSFSPEDLTVKISSGTVKSEYALRTKQANLTTTAGTIKLEELVADNFDIEASSGTIQVENLTGSGRIGITAGSVKLKKVTMTGNLTAKSSSGNISIGLAGSPSLEFTGDVSSGTISTYFPANTSGTGGKHSTATVGSGPYYKLNISATAGSIKITEA